MKQEILDLIGGEWSYIEWKWVEFGLATLQTPVCSPCLCTSIEVRHGICMSQIPAISQLKSNLPSLTPNPLTHIPGFLSEVLHIIHHAQTPPTSPEDNLVRLFLESKNRITQFHTSSQSPYGTVKKRPKTLTQNR